MNHVDDVVDGHDALHATLGVDDGGTTYNVNADEAAGALARALHAEKLILLTDVEGVKDRSGRLISRLTREEVRKHLRPWIPLVSLAKGLEQGTHLRMTEVIRQVLPDHRAGVLTGPNLAREIMSGLAAASVIAIDDEMVARQLQGVFHSGLFRVYTNRDVAGCELGGALKNVIAIAVGMGEGLEVGDNTRAAVITRAAVEPSRSGFVMW